MNLKLFLVWHDEDVLTRELARIETDEEFAENWFGGPPTRRYLIWAESPRDAALGVQALKLEQKRELPKFYRVNPMKTGPHWEVKELSEDDNADLEYDVDIYESMFSTQAVVVQM